MKQKRGYYDVFVRTCAKYPSRIAVTYYDYGEYKSYTYSELFGVCEYIAQNIQRLQCGRGVVGLVSDRNIIIPCIIAAVHKCCTSFMFVDPSQEIESVANQLQFPVVIFINKESYGLPSLWAGKMPNETITVFGYHISFYNFDKTDDTSKSTLDHSFIAQTSGSTGQAKHVQVPIQCIQPNIDDLTNLFNVTPEDVIYFSTPLTFDPSMVEILLACSNGASLLIAPPTVEILFPEDKEYSVSIWQTTPSNFFQQTNANIRNKILHENSTLRILAFGGEPLNGLKRLIDLRDSKNKTRIFTLYGVTEMSCWACVTEVDLNKCNVEREIPLGNCLSETKIVLEPQDDKKDTKQIILVSKTRKCVVLNHKQEGNSLKFVETGDLAEVKNGTIYYRGRKDDVIKRFGHKINLQHIESVVMQCPRIKTCSCLWLPKPMLLIVYFSSETFNSQELSDFLKCKLDDRHWPDKIIRVNNLPTTAHGKTSKFMLSTMFEDSNSPLSPDSIKVTLLNEIKHILNHNFIYDDIKDKHFFDLGGTSFLAVTMCNKISSTRPQLGKFVLPHLMSLKYTIDQIAQTAANETFAEVTRSIVKKKRRRSSTEVDKKLSMKKVASSSVTNGVEFIVLWSCDTGKCVDASPTLFQTNLHLYVAIGSHSGRIMVFDALTGIPEGTIKLRSRVEASVFCFHNPRNVACGVVGAYNGTVICFGLVGCKEKWRVNVGHMVKSKATFCNGFLYVATYAGQVMVLEAMTGAIQSSIVIAEEAISADLVLAKNQYILVATLSAACACIQVDINSVVWRGTVGSPIFANPVLYCQDKYVLFAEVNGEVHCRTVEKGITIWRYQGAKGNIFSSICVREVDPLRWQIIFGCHDCKVYSINVKNFQPTAHWNTELAAPVYSTPCILGTKHVLAASKDGNMYAIDLDNGSIVAEHKLPSETFSSPSVFRDYIYIGCRNDFIYALQYILN